MKMYIRARNTSRERIPPSPCTQGEGWGGGRTGIGERSPHPGPPPEYQGRVRKCGALLAISLAMFTGGCAADVPTTRPAAAVQPDSPDWWRMLTASLRGQQLVSDDSFAVIVPRNDIDLESEMGQIPTSAGIASRFYFFRCPCGKVKLLGDFLACDFERDDVLDALRAGKFEVVSMSPILENTRPNLVSIRFQAEGEGEDLVKTLRSALDAVARHHTTGPDD